MAAPGSRHVRERTWDRISQPKKPRPNALAWALFLVIGMPLGIMAALGLLAATGIYVDVLRPLWRPWPSDALKSFLGIAGFAATLAYLSYRKGRERGYKSGTLAAVATFRNIAEGRDEASPEPSPGNSPRRPL